MEETLLCAFEVGMGLCIPLPSLCCVASDNLLEPAVTGHGQACSGSPTSLADSVVSDGSDIDKRAQNAGSCELCMRGSPKLFDAQPHVGLQLRLTGLQLGVGDDGDFGNFFMTEELFTSEVEILAIDSIPVVVFAELAIDKHVGKHEVSTEKLPGLKRRHIAMTLCAIFLSPQFRIGAGFTGPARSNRLNHGVALVHSSSR